MDMLTKFWERQAVWMQKVEGYATFSAIVCLVISAFILESGKPLGFVMVMLSLWCFGIRMGYELWHVDENGDSKIRTASPFVQLVFSWFYAFWFVGLTFITMVLYAKINS